MNPVPHEHLVASLQWRYATKVFEVTKKIPAATWSALEQALILTPSSYGLQPWRFIVVTDEALKRELRKHSWNQAQVSDCSHYVIFAAVKNISEAEIDRFVAHTAQVRGTTVDSMAGYRKMMVSYVVEGPRGGQEWATRQVYIALGNFMTSAAVLQIDTCPMEGFVPEEYDKILGLPERGLMSVVCCAAGYRSAEDKYAGMPKVRFPHSEMIETR